MGARYPYYLLADSTDGRRKEAEITSTVPSEGPTRGDVGQGFVYKRVPHITLKSIANNAEIRRVERQSLGRGRPSRGGAEAPEPRATFLKRHHGSLYIRPMSDRSPIEWTDATWNPVRGCSKVSPGCAHCYAERFAERFRDVPGHPFEQGFDPRLAPDMLHRPLAWRRPRRIFVNSMSDLFHADVPVEYIEAVGRVMQQADWHTFQVLTKRHHRMQRLLGGDLRWMGALPNVWFGVSVEDRRHGFPRLTALRRTPASVRFGRLGEAPRVTDAGEIDLASRES